MHLGREEGVGGSSRLRSTSSSPLLPGSVLFTHGVNPLKSLGSEDSIPVFHNYGNGPGTVK